MKLFEKVVTPSLFWPMPLSPKAFPREHSNSVRDCIVGGLRGRHAEHPADSPMVGAFLADRVVIADVDDGVSVFETGVAEVVECFDTESHG